MTTSNKTVEILAESKTAGYCDLVRVTRLVRRGDTVYLVRDEWCGEETLEGEAYREFLYEIPGSEVNALAAAIREDDTDYIDYAILPAVRCLGRVS